MKVNYIVISIIISVSLSFFFYQKNHLKSIRLKENGIVTDIKEYYLYNGDNEDSYFYNYYFIANDSLEVKTTHNLNRKSLKIGIKKYQNKKIIYLRNNPLIFMTKEELYNNHYKYYFVSLPIFFYFILWFFKDYIVKFLKYLSLLKKKL